MSAEESEEIAPAAKSDVAISVRNLTKVFPVYERPMDIVREFITGRPRHSPFKALDDVSFDVKKGEIVGVVGRNGAGKSTLLRLIAGVTAPTSGTVDVLGQVSALLELGSGFNGDYTGRENVFMGGLCIGMTRAQIEEKVDWIIEFSELQNFIDQPFRTYSSGMQSRLAFATAISMEPDILIVDEALSVGDGLFQEKCFRRVRELTANGASVLFVSHSLSSVAVLCRRAIMLVDGELKRAGHPREIIEAYEVHMAEARELARGLRSTALEPVSVDGGVGASIVDMKLYDNMGLDTQTLESGEFYTVEIFVLFRQNTENLSIGFSIQLPNGLRIYAKNTFSERLLVQGTKDEIVAVRFRMKCSLAAGTYFVGNALSERIESGEFRNIQLNRSAMSIVVHGGEERFGGIVDLGAEVAVSRDNRADSNE